MWTVLIAAIAMIATGGWIVEHKWRTRYENAARVERIHARMVDSELEAYKLANLRKESEQREREASYHLHGSTFVDRTLTSAQQREWPTMAVVWKGRG